MRLLEQLSVCTLLGHITVSFIVCDVTLLQFLASWSEVRVVGQSGQCGGDARGLQFFCHVHLLQHLQLTTGGNGVPTDLGVMLAGMCHAFQFLQYLVMYLVHIPKPRLPHGNVDEPGVFINIGVVAAETAYLSLRIAIFLQYGVPFI